MSDLSHVILPPIYDSVLLHGAARSGVHFLGLQVAAEFATEGRTIFLIEREADQGAIRDRLAGWQKHNGIAGALDLHFVTDPRSGRASDYAQAIKPAWPNGARPVLIVRDVARRLSYDAANDPFLPIARHLRQQARAYWLTVAATFRPVPIDAAGVIHELTLLPGASETSRLELHQRKPDGREPITLAVKTLPTTVVFEIDETRKPQPAATAMEAAHV